MHQINELFISSFFSIEKLSEAKKLSWGKAVFYTLFLTVILALPITTDTWTTTSEMLDDAKTIAQKIPDFSLKDGAIETKQDKSFIYQTNHFIFTFDPKGERTIDEVKSDAAGSAFAFAFLKDRFTFVLPSILTDENGTNQAPMSIKYTNKVFKGATGAKIRKVVLETQQPAWMFIIIYLIAYLPALFGLVVNLLVLTIAAVLYNKMSRIPLKFGETLKTMLLALTAPIILSTIICFFIPTIDTSFIQMIMGLLIYFKAAGPLRPKKEIPPVE
jgi:maltodextrin utilization protein YvdJ